MKLSRKSKVEILRNGLSKPRTFTICLHTRIICVKNALQNLRLFVKFIKTFPTCKNFFNIPYILKKDLEKQVTVDFNNLKYISN